MLGSMLPFEKTFRFSYRQTDLSCSAATWLPSVFWPEDVCVTIFWGSYQEISIWQTNARPDEVEALFPKTIGVVRVSVSS